LKIENITKEFDQMPTATDVKEIIIKHFEIKNNIIFVMQDDSIYKYSKSDIGNPTEIRANHNTIIFQTGRFFYIKYIKRIYSHTNTK